MGVFAGFYHLVETLRRDQICVSCIDLLIVDYWQIVHLFAVGLGSCHLTTNYIGGWDPSHDRQSNPIECQTQKRVNEVRSKCRAAFDPWMNLATKKIREVPEG